ncbi:hypothetical protein KXS11_17465 [Plantibacter flavus]|uniref:hypothetical protein n=1 Tax=Plantibacter flavus TaxID=150123 RepID=UPI003F15B3BD
MKRTLVLASLCLLAVFAVPTAANATTESTYGPMGCATITPVAVTQGESATFSCDDTFTPDTPVTVTVAGPGCHLPAAEPTTAGATAQSGTQQSAVLTSAAYAADATRAFAVKIETSKTESGTCTVTATQGTTTETASFQVSERAFASTGFSGALLPWIGGGLLVAGIAAFAVVGVRRCHAA